MSANPQSRKWMLTINNPKDCGLDHDGMTATLLTAQLQQIKFPRMPQDVLCCMMGRYFKPIFL